jgi:membrane dipeptidase
MSRIWSLGGLGLCALLLLPCCRGTAEAAGNLSASASAPVSAAPLPRPAPAKLDPEQRAAELAQRLIILDGHIDVPWRLWQSRDKQGALGEDVSQRTERGDFDFPRARQGGLDAPFMSIYVPARYETGGAKKLADSMIDMVARLAESHPEKFAIARSPADVRNNFAARKISLALGLENGSPIEKQLGNLTHFHERGVRYITLAHSKDNHIADSSYDDRRVNKGLSQFGEKVVLEMNRLGLMVDVSHLSDDAFWDVMRTSKLPVIASHSSCRKFTPGWARNMSDEMIKALASKGGVIQINFGSGFIDGKIQKQQAKFYRELKAELARQRLEMDSPKAKPVIERFKQSHELTFASVEQVADHIDHVVALAGIDHVGLGSDFDGVGDTLPTGLKDVSQYPNLIRVLLERGYSEAQIEKICSGNVLRVWQAVEDHAVAARVEKAQ